MSTIAPIALVVLCAALYSLLRRRAIIKRNMRVYEQDVWVRPSWLVEVYPRPLNEWEWWNEEPMQMGQDID